MNKKNIEKEFKDYLNYNGKFYCWNCNIEISADINTKDESCNCKNEKHQYWELWCKNCCKIERN